MLKDKWKEVQRLFKLASIDPQIVEFKGFLTFLATIRGENSDLKNLEVSFSLLRFDNEIMCIFVFNDITAKIQVTALKETINYKNRLLASVSHELRTPLNGTINLIETAIEDKTVSQ